MLFRFKGASLVPRLSFKGTIFQITLEVLFGFKGKVQKKKKN